MNIELNNKEILLLKKLINKNLNDYNNRKINLGLKSLENHYSIISKLKRPNK